MTPLRLGISPCPNDTYIFFALLRHFQDQLPVEVHFHDIEELNQLALEGAYDAVKISCALLDSVSAEYGLLRSGGALGRGCGPLLVSAGAKALFPGARVLSPGRHTTAQRLFQRYCPLSVNLEYRLFSDIMEALAAGKADFGILIHESRFTYQEHGLSLVQDLGVWWEETTGAPIPLGGIVLRRSCDPALASQLETLIRQSIAYARNHRAEVLDFCRQYAQEIDDAVMGSHIELYVNQYSHDIGPDGIRAIAYLLFGDHTAEPNFLWSQT
ncbi:1,4-dihydroxy-6-naphthoate synthase [Desulfurispirillum indicum]|uniref:1,4-dihydroxy-6-naphtoate synthase n=1 Tax=Desulfurispirillum indicum (strain ATCC BAA-1389 / DSM 22839 / S5) TaxID=653733 RepID=E6W142_DESIS|nr:1,4-dihydroxy-6-naphthoate synthase [Desulfurispirillum indicum]ADU66462.1 hypothetical protein Selin_1733 [Desulfurispirillum indicum S5]UCZ55798.1 1,4-dihydroxy-6-naphthoate synthase [Desulfurispirillum indicum]